MRGAAAALALCVAGCNARQDERRADAVPSALASAAPPPGDAGAAPATVTRRVELSVAAEESDALSLVRTKRLAAKAAGRVLVVYVGAAWCEPCRRFKAEVESGRLDARLGTVTLLAFDADRDQARLEAAGYQYRFVPFVALPGADGRPTDSQQATGKGGDAWRELIAKLEAWQGGSPR